MDSRFRNSPVYLLIVLNIFLAYTTTLAQSTVHQSFGVIKDDFLVNDDTIGYCEQDYPAVCFGQNGFFALSWMDHRDYYYDDIYFQLYDSSGNRIGHNRRVNDDGGQIWQMYPAIAMDSVGNTAVVWGDRRRDMWGDVFGQRYSSDGLPIGVNFRINDDDSVPLDQSTEDIAMRPDGSFVVMWVDTREGNINKIYAQRYDAMGSPSGVNFKIVDQYTIWCSIAADSIGNFYVTWVAGSNVFVRKFDYNGNPITESFQVSDTAAAASGDGYPRIACSNEGKFIITWTDSRNNLQWAWDVYAQLYDKLCNPVGLNFRVNGDSEQVHQSRPSVAMDGSGNFAICWQDYRGSQENIYAQRYDTLGNPIEVNFIVNENPGLRRNLHPRTAMNSQGDFIITWDQIKSLNYWAPDIVAQRFNALGNMVGNNFVVNDDTAANNQAVQCIATRQDRGFVVAWSDCRDSIAAAVYYQVYDSLGNPLGVNRKANTQDANYTSAIDAVMDGKGNFTLVWTEDAGLRGQRFDSLGNFIGNNFTVMSGTYPDNLAVAMDWAGNFVVSMCDDRYGVYDNIYAQRYDSRGNPVGTVFQVNTGSGYILYNDAAMDSSGDFIIGWCRYEGDIDDGVYVQRYDENGNPVGGNYKINDDSTSVFTCCPSMGVDRYGNVVVAWCKWVGSYDICAQMLDSLGNKIGNNITVNNCPSFSQLANPSVSSHPISDKFVVFWTDWRNIDGDPEVFAQLYESVVPVGQNIQINNPDSFPYNLQGTTIHSIDATTNRIYFAWLDCRRHKGADTYAKITDWELLYGYDEFNKENAIDFSLNIYPTLSTGAFTIEYRTCDLNSINYLRIYDISGRLVKKFDELTFKSINKIMWDGHDDLGNKSPSGIYFVTFTNLDHKETRKVLLIR